MEKIKLVRLANELTDFCLEYKIFNTTCGARELKQRIEAQFCDVVFVEGLITRIIKRAKNHPGIDKSKLIELLSELERLRLELEFKGMNGK